MDKFVIHCCNCGKIGTIVQRDKNIDTFGDINIENIYSDSSGFNIHCFNCGNDIVIRN